MYDLRRFTLSDMAELGTALRMNGARCATMEEAATRIVQMLRGQLVDRSTGMAQCTLVRFFKTHPYGALEPRLQQFARSVFGAETYPDATRCLTLLGTAGARAEWNSRHASSGHQAIPLPDVKIVSSAPMIANLVRQFGLEIASVVEPDPASFIEQGERTFNVFHVPEATGSPFVPAQDGFVIPMGIRSVMAFGSMLSSGDIFAVIMFTRVPIARDVAEMFPTIALNIKISLLPLERSVFGT